ncbi:hypothetical protein Mapa_000622 [Marchantia paleacea]|nr:hypothetical protein Mapa_000622 [Marchantia paleacea]
MEHFHVSLSYHVWIYILSAGILLDCNVWAHSNLNQRDGNPFAHGFRSDNRTQANLGGKQSTPAARSSVSHIYHKDSPFRPAGCDDECIHELRINSTLSHMDLRRRNVKFPRTGWRGTVDTGFYVRTLAAEWYTTFLVGTPREYGKEQVVQLALDTGSPFTWFQCQPCFRCFPQKIRLFNRKKSTSYRRQNERDSYCHKVQKFKGSLGIGATPDVCRYLIEYSDISESRGVVGQELFKLEDAFNRGQLLVIGPLGFGCGIDNDASIKGGAGGILGLSNSRAGISVPEQLSSLFGSQFGYCLTSLNEPTGSGYIYFGEAAVPSDSTQWTNFVNLQTWYFYVDVVDMSVNGQRLNVPPGTFDIDNQGQGGVMIDSGAPYSFLTPVAFDLLVAALSTVFDQLGTTPYYPPKRGSIGPCWGAKNLDQNSFPFPRVAWLFRDGSSLELSTAGTYVLYKTNSKLMSLCVPFVRDVSRPPVISAIGGHSQINTYMFFDQVNQRLVWSYNAC